VERGLVERAAELARTALAAGALRPLPSECHRVPDGGIEFLVHVLRGPGAKPEAAAPGSAPRPNPFLPPEPALLVGEISPTHLCVLNKYPVVAGHLLAVTRRYEPQEREPGPDDLAAVWALLAEVDGLAFYNSGPESGASQPHKHLQFVPAFEPGRRTPIERALVGAEDAAGIRPGLPFAHTARRLAGLPGGDAAGEPLARAVRELGEALGSEARGRPWNLLLTRDWMLRVPRSRAAADGIQVNALGFAGSLAVRGDASLEQLRRMGPLELLKKTALPGGGFPASPRD